MLTPGFKFFFGFALFALAAAWVYGFASGGDQALIAHVLGPLTFGWKGGVGDHFGYTVLVSTAAVSGFIGCLLVAFRDADPDAEAGALHAESVPLTQVPADASYWPIVGAFSLSVLVVGFVVGTSMVLVGATLLTITIVEWTVKAWSERATGDPATNREIRDRVMYPLEIPVAGFLCVATIFLGVSRVLLAVDKTTAVVIGGVVAVLVFAVAIAIATRPQMKRGVLTAVVVLFGLAVLGGGIASAVIGERDFEEHEGEEHSGSTEEEGSLAPLPVVAEAPSQGEAA